MSAAGLHTVAFAVVALLQLPPPSTPASSPQDTLAPQRLTASAAVTPDTVTVGDHFRVVLRIDAPPSATVQFPRFNLIEPVEAVDSLRVARDSAGTWSATYVLTAWTTSDSLVASFPFRVRAADGSFEDLRVRLVLPHVLSVLPADSTLHLPRPAKAVIPIAVAGPTSRGWLAPAVLLLLVLAAIVWLALRRRASAFAEPTDPRSAALARLREIETEGLPERGMAHEYYVRTSRVLREYLRATGGWGEDLTTTELVLALESAGMDVALRRDVALLLRESDRVKFSGEVARGAVPRQDSFGEAVGGWIEEWPPRPEASEERSEAA